MKLKRLHPRSEAAWREALSTRARIGADASASAATAAIVADVRSRGDEAVAAYASKFDRVSLTPARFRVSESEWSALAARCPAPVVAALELAAARIAEFHRRQLPGPVRWEHDGATLEHRPVPLSAVLCYAPGGRAVYPSSVLMGAVPARVAGVARVAVTSPAKAEDDLAPAIAAAARIAGATELWRLGGVQAIAAFALGTESVPAVDKIVGPGNTFVTEAKRQLNGEVGFDSLAGPTEVLILAEHGVADPRWIACDLIAQAEHDPEARAVLVTTSERLVDEVEAALDLESIGPVARQALESHGVAVIADGLDAAIAFAERYAPEHLELLVHDTDAVLARLTTTGCVFVGPHTPVPVGDYLAGANHTLPTAGTGRFASGLSVHDFLRRQSVVRYSADRLRRDTPALRALADAEGLPAHARAAEVRGS